MKPLSETISKSKKSSIRELFELVLKAKNAISFGIGQPDFTPPDHVNQAMIEAIKQKKSQYAPTLGLPQLRELIIKKFQVENGMNWLKTENVMVTNGGSHALQLAYASLSNQGDEMIVSSPNFLSYYYLAGFYGLKCVEIPRKRDYSPNIEQIKEKITDKTKFIIINSPNNPTGYTFSRPEIDAIVEIVQDNDLYLVSDEVYEKFLYDGIEIKSPGSYPGMEERTITLNAMSKTFGAPGYRVGYIAASSKIIQLMEKYAQYTAAGVSHPTQYAAIAALEKGNDELPMIIKKYQQKRDYCIKRLQEAQFDVVIPQGAFYIMPSVKPFGMNSDEFAQKLMKEQEVAVVPGSGFGSHSEDKIRISYATEDEKLAEGFDRIETFLKNNNLL